MHSLHFHPCRRAPLTEKGGTHAHVSSVHQDPNCFSPACFTAWPHILRFNPKLFHPHTTAQMWPHAATPTAYVVPLHCSVHCGLPHTVLHRPNLTASFSSNSDHQQTLQYDSPGGPLQTCFIIWPALSIVSASFDKFTSNRYNAAVFLLAEDNCSHSEGPGP